MTSATFDLAGRRILIVEDEALVAIDAELMIEDLGGRVVGPATTLGDGLLLAQSAEIDAALLDVNLNGSRSDAIAEVLKARQIPFIFATGYGDRKDRDNVPVVAKPYQSQTIGEALAKILA